MHRFLRQLTWRFQRRKREADLQDELAFHLDAEAEERGTGVEARLAAVRDLGNVCAVQENTRAAWGWSGVEQLLQDLRYGLRGLRKSPAFTATAVLSLALGIGANTAIFSLIDALMLRMLPVSDPGSLLQVRFAASGTSGPGESLSYAIVRAMAEKKDIFAGVGGFSGWTFNAGSGAAITRVQGALVTGGYYQTLGLSPAAGRLLGMEDDEPGAPLAAVISYGYWERQFSKSPATVGSTVILNRVPVTVVGVSPAGFVGTNVGQVADVTMTAAALPSVNPEAAALLGKGNFWLRILARPNPQVPVPQATSRLAAAWVGMAEQVVRPEWSARQKKDLASARFELVPGGTGWTYLRSIFQKPLWILMGVVALVLVIACANVANLLLARATVRQREIAVRLAIGAGRGRIIRQLLTESVLLSACGAILGIGLAWITARLVVDVLSSGLDKVTFDLTPNWHVLGWTSAVAVATGILFGLAPALQGAGVGTSLKADHRTGRARLHSGLVVVQVALSLVLLIGAGLLVRTLRNLQNVDLGFGREGVLVVNLEGRRTPFGSDQLEELRRIPGVVSASVGTHTPLNGSTWSEPAVPLGQPLPDRDNAHFIGAGPRFFETLQMQLLAGRDFSERDSIGAHGVAVINEAYAARHFPQQNPVGQQLSTKISGQRKELEVIGVVKNAGLAGLRTQAPPAVYVAYYQLGSRDGAVAANFPSTVVVRASGSLSRVADAVRSKLQPQMPDTPLEVRPLSAQVEAAMVQERLLALLAAIFGGLALVLAFIGLYGLLGYSVARRTRELGIRMALGAQRSGVVSIVLRRALGLVLGGVMVGLPAALVASQWVKSMLFGLRPEDPATLAGAAIVLVAAGVGAAYFPARRAAGIDPVAALREE